MKRILLALALLIAVIAPASAGRHGAWPQPATLTPLDASSGGSWNGTATSCNPLGGGAAGCPSSSMYGSGWQFMPVTYFDEPTGYQNQSAFAVAAGRILTTPYPICVGDPLMGAPAGQIPAKLKVKYWLEGNTVTVTDPNRSSKGTFGYCVNVQGTANFNGWAALCAETIPQNGPSRVICMEIDLQNGAASKRATHTYYVDTTGLNNVTDVSDAYDGLSDTNGHAWATILCHLNGSHAGCTPATQVSGGCIDIMVKAGSYVNENATVAWGHLGVGSPSTCGDRVMSTDSGCGIGPALIHCFTLDDTIPLDNILPNAQAIEFIGAHAIYPTTGGSMNDVMGSNLPFSVWFDQSVLEDTNGPQGGPVPGGAQYYNFFFAQGQNGGGAYNNGFSVTNSTLIGIYPDNMKLSRNNHIIFGQEIFDFGATTQGFAAFNNVYENPDWAFYTVFQNTNPGFLVTAQSVAVVDATDPICYSLSVTHCLKILWDPTNIFSIGQYESSRSYAAATFGGGSIITSALNPSANQMVWLLPAAGSTLPTPLSPGVEYFVINQSGSTFQVCAASGCPGGAISFGSAAGTFTAIKSSGLVLANPQQICMTSGTGYEGGRTLGVWNPNFGTFSAPNVGEKGCFNYDANTAWAGTNTTNGYATYFKINSNTSQFPPGWAACINNGISDPGCPSVGNQAGVHAGQHTNWLRLNSLGTATDTSNLVYLQGLTINTNGGTFLGQDGANVVQTGKEMTTTGNAAHFAANVPTLCNGDTVQVPALGQSHVVMSIVSPANSVQFGDVNACSSNVSDVMLDDSFHNMQIPSTGPMIGNFNLTATTSLGAGTYRNIENAGFFTKNSLGYLTLGFQTAAVPGNAVWSSSTTYSSAGGTAVAYGGHEYTSSAIANNIGQQPDISPSYWTMTDPTFTLTAASFCPQISTYPTTGNQYQCDSGPTMLTFGGNAGMTCTGISKVCWSDAFASSLVTTGNYVVSVDESSEANGGGGSGSGGNATNASTTWVAGGSSAAQANPTLSGAPTGCGSSCPGGNPAVIAKDFFVNGAYSQIDPPGPPSAINVTGATWYRIRSVTNFGARNIAVNISIPGGNNDQKPQGYVNWLWDGVTYNGQGSTFSVGANTGQTAYAPWIMYNSNWIPSGLALGVSQIGAASDAVYYAYPNQYGGILNYTTNIVPVGSAAFPVLSFTPGTNMVNQTPLFGYTGIIGSFDSRPVTASGAPCAFAAGSWGPCPLTQQSRVNAVRMDNRGNTYGPGTPRPSALSGSTQPN